MRFLIGASRIVALGVVVISAHLANAQSPLPPLEPGVARELFGVYASCEAYWKVIRECLPPGLSPQDQARVQKSFDRLQADGVEQMKWLGAKAQLSAGMQQRIADQASVTVNAAMGNNCANAPALVHEYRDKCAALFQNVGTAQNAPPPVNQPTAAEIAQSAADFAISTCYEPIDNVSRVNSYARMMGWKALSADQKNLLRPVDSSDYEAWQVDHDGDMYVISVSHSHFKGHPTEVCQVNIPHRAEAVMPRITEKIKTRLIGSNNNAGQITELYELIDHPSVNSAIMVVGRPTDERAFFTVAFIGIK